MATTIQETIIKALETGSWLIFFIVFWGGALLSLSSCTIVRVPIIVGLVGGAAASKKRAIFITLSFVSALVLSYTLLGVLFGLISGIMHSMIRLSRYFYYAIGGLALFIGAQMANLVEFDFFRRIEKLKILEPKRAGLLVAFLFGIIFAIFEAPVCPCCGPVLFIIAGLTFAKGNILFAILVFLAYALGQSFPILLIGSFTSIMKYISPKLSEIEGTIRFVGGNILIVIGLYFFFVG